MTSDIFCQIIAGELATTEVWRDEQVVAFLDHRPVFKGHVLVCPTRHVDTLLDLPDDLVVPLFGAARAIAAVMGPALGA
jgi:histidine triad (HIT) family protein